MYALQSGVVVKRRKPLLIPMLLLLAGAALLVMNNLYGAEVSNNLRSAVVFIGGLTALVGLVGTVVRLVGSGGIPYHKGDRCYLRYEELYFDRKAWQEVTECVQRGEVARLLSMPHSGVPAVTVSLYHTPDNRIAAMQAYEFMDLEYKPLSEIKVFGM